jgi:hypothetical protein
MQQFEIWAETVREKLKLNYDEKSIEYLEDFIERVKPNYENRDATGVINSIGAFLGQCIIINYGGAWGIDDESERDCVLFDERTKIFPFAKTAKQFSNGLEDSIHSFYRAIPTILEMGKSKG